MNISGQKRRPMTSFWRYKVYADIRGQWGCRLRQFSAFSLAISSETLERPALLHSVVRRQLFSDSEMHDLE